MHPNKCLFSNSSLPEICRSTCVPTDQLPVRRMRFLLCFVKLRAAFVKIPPSCFGWQRSMAFFSLLYAYALFDFKFGSCTCRCVRSSFAVALTMRKMEEGERLGYKRKENIWSITCRTDQANEANKRYKYHEEIADYIFGLSNLTTPSKVVEATEDKASMCELSKHHCYCYCETFFRPGATAADIEIVGNNQPTLLEKIHKVHK